HLIHDSALSRGADTGILSAFVKADFVRITASPLISMFLSQLDHYSAQLIKVFIENGGSTGRKISILMSQVTQ
ncbi:hypothetical protein GOODEAATRI_017107, partial [Goodea atripinnis]